MTTDLEIEIGRRIFRLGLGHTSPNKKRRAALWCIAMNLICPVDRNTFSRIACCIPSVITGRL